MRPGLKAAFAAILAALALPASAQEAAPAASPAPAAAPTPQAPIPYATLQKRAAATTARAKAASRPAATATGAAPATAGGPASPAAPVGAVPALPVTASGARLSPAEPLPPAELEAFVDGVVKDAMGRDHIAGVTVSVVQDGQVMLKKGYGFARLAPDRRVDPDRTLFRIGSISKTFTWIALMKEVEAGRIRIDAPVNLYLPERLQIRDQGFRTPVRVINLMDHSAGFEDRALGHLFERRFERERPIADYLRQERPRRVHTPGEISSYSNYGSALAGQAVSWVSGKPFEQLIEEEITRPLRMSRTTFREPHPVKAGYPAPMAPSLAADLSDAYRWTPTGFERRDFEYVGHIAPAGSASSTAADMARYMILLLNRGALEGATIYGPRAARAFDTPIRRTAPGVNGWRHGFIAYTLPGGWRGMGHDGATLSFMSQMVVIPELRLGVFISTNTDTGSDLAQRFAGGLVQQFYAPPAPLPRKGSAELADQAGAFSGYYLSTRRAYTGLEGFVDRFVSGVNVDVTPDGRLVTTGDEARTWVPEGAPSQGQFIAVSGSERLVFRMSGGRGAAFQGRTGANLYERAPFWARPITLAVLAALTGLAAAATLGGVVLRNRREHRETSIQSRASLMQNTQAALWLTALALFAIWASKTGDIAKVMYGWPGASLVIASACALVAAGLTLVTLVFLPAIWRGGRRVDSWSPLRKAAYSVTVLIYVAFAVVLGLWGALSPWSG